MTTNTPGEAIHKFCVQCVDSIYEVKNCGGEKCLNGGCDEKGVCLFYKFRLGTGRPSVKQIRRYCLCCASGDFEYIRQCPDGIKHGGMAACALYPFRMGKNPNIVLSEEEKLRRSHQLNPRLSADFRR